MDWNSGSNDICGSKRRFIGILITFFLSPRLLISFIQRVFEGMNAESLECSIEIYQMSLGLDVVIVHAVVICLLDRFKTFEESSIP